MFPRRGYPMFTKFGIVMVVVSEIERSVSFYRDTLGLSLKFTSPEFAQFDVDGVNLGLHPKSEHLPASTSGGISFGFYVDDIEATLATLHSRGVKLLHRSSENFGELSIIADPDGYGIQICQMKKW
jgi:lactoylglutathione lyase